MKLFLKELKQLLKWYDNLSYRGQGDTILALRIEKELKLKEENEVIESRWRESVVCEGWLEASSITPSRSIGSNGEVVLEWWGRENRKLTVFLDDNETTYIMSWGSNIHNEMEDGIIVNEGDKTHLIKWLEGK